MPANHEAFWDDLRRDLQDRPFRAAYRWASLRIAAVDLVVNALRRINRRPVRED